MPKDHRHDEVALSDVYASTKTILDAIQESQKAAHEQAQQTRDLIRRRSDRLEAQNERVLAELERITTPVIHVHRITVVASGQTVHIPSLREFQGEEDMSNSTYSNIPRDHADAPFTLAPLVISDDEGPIDIPVVEALVVDNPSVVDIVGDAPNQSFHFGTFGTCNFSRKATFTPPGPNAVETTVTVDTIVFNLTPGALTIVGGVSIEGMTPDAVPEG